MSRLGALAPEQEAAIGGILEEIDRTIVPVEALLNAAASRGVDPDLLASLRSRHDEIRNEMNAIAWMEASYEDVRAHTYALFDRARELRRDAERAAGMSRSTKVVLTTAAVVFGGVAAAWGLWMLAGKQTKRRRRRRSRRRRR